MIAPRAIVPVARLGVDLAARALPTRADRERYATEFLAELSGMPPSAQLRHTVGVLSQTVALRPALSASAPRQPEKPWRCRYLHWHRWHNVSADDGGRYVACSGCGRERAWDSPQPGGWVA